VFEKSTEVLVGKILLRNESCDTVQRFRDKIFRKNLPQHVEELRRVGLDTIELLTSFGYSSLPFVWNNQISIERNVRSVDELWFYVWANHLENTGAHSNHDGEYPEKLNFEQEAVIRKIVQDWEVELAKVFSTKKLALYSLCAIPNKDYLIVGMGRSLLEDFRHPITVYMDTQPDILISKTLGYINREVGESLTVYNFIAPHALKDSLESYTMLRHGTAYLCSKINEKQVEALMINKSLIETELALSTKTISFGDFQKLHSNTLNYSFR
jgi:hypothetical protein